jgi:hypothetical protein
MQSTAARVSVGVIAVVIVVVAFIVLSGGDDGGDSTTQTTATTTQSTGGDETTGGSGKSDKGDSGEVTADIPVIDIKDGEAVGGVQDLTFNQGDTIRFEVDSDAAYEIHFHGYDVAQEVEAGGSTEFSVPADIEGIFEVEIEDTATQIAQITVNP